MNNVNVVPFDKKQSGCELITAEIKAVSETSVVIDTEYGVLNARKAFSCLVTLDVGDIVLVNYSPGTCHVLSVLERPDSDTVDVTFPGDAKITAKTGNLDIVAAEDINLISAADTNVLSRKISMTSPEMSMQINSLKASMTDVDAISTNVKLNTKFLDVTAKQITQKTDVLVRWVESIETLNIGSLIQNIRHNHTSHSQQAVITASKDMRIDAERIHMG